MNWHGIQALAVGHTPPDPAWKMKAHAHPFHELIVPLHGKMSVAADSQTMDAAAGDALLYPAGSRHAEWTNAADPVEALFVSFQTARLPVARVTRAPDTNGRMRQLISWLHEDRHTVLPEAKAQRQALLAALLLEFFRCLRAPENPLVGQTRQYIQNHLAEPLVLADLARQAQQSKYHFLRTYKALTGRTPMAEVRWLRANYARELILSTSLPPKAIAVRAGLGNEYAMSRVFRHCFNLPPGEWRRHRSRKGTTKEGHKPLESREAVGR